MKIKTLLFFCGMLLANICLAQKALNTEKSDSTNVYQNALAIYCNTLEKDKNTVIYVEPNYLLTEKLPSVIKNIEIKYPDPIQLRKLIKENGGRITLLRILPLRVNQSDFFVNIIPFNATYNKNNLNLANGGGLTVHYKFDANLDGLIYDRHNFSGI